MDNIREELENCCKKLKLSKNLAARAFELEGETNQEYLLKLFTREIEYRQKTRVDKLMNAAGFPVRYAPSQYKADEIGFPEGVSLESILNLDFYDAGENLILYGGTGTGKTMLSILAGLEACKRGIPVAFFRTASLVNKFTENHANGTLSKFKKKLDKSRILILDEFGYVPYDRTGSQLLFDYLSEVEGRKVIILNTNLEFAKWVNVLYDQSMTTALIGRLTHHVQLLLFPGGNNRLRESSINEVIARMNPREG